MTDPPAPPAPAGPPPPGPTTEDRQDRQIAELRTEQQRQGTVLDELRSLIKGQQDGPGAPPVRGDPPPAAAPDITEQVRQAVRDVNAEQAVAGAKPAPPKPERRPREVGQPGRQRLQRFLFGGE